MEHGVHSRPVERLSLKTLAFWVFILLVLPGAVASANFFSFFGDMFTRVTIEEKSINSQNVSLLAAAAHSDIDKKTEQADTNTVGNSALLPDAGPTGGLADVDVTNFDHGQISVYVVRDGDSLSSIASMFEVSVNTILWANSLPKGAKIKVGQTLVILPVSGVQHTVKKGDTIASIAKKYKGDVNEILSYNGLEDAPLALDSLVIIPDGEIPTPKVVVKPASSKLRGSTAPSYEGYYQAPLFGYRKTQGLHGYNGVDLVASQGVGAPVVAAAAGTVIISRQGGYNGGYGVYLVIQHSNGTQTLYGHMKSNVVSVGQYVTQGQMVGTMGNSGRSSGPHLHFEIRGARNPF